MFDLGYFIKRGLLDAVGKMADYKVILNAAGWHEKGVLTVDDLAEIQTAIEAQYIVPEEPIEEPAEEPTEESIEEPEVEPEVESEVEPPEEPEQVKEEDAWQC